MPRKSTTLNSAYDKLRATLLASPSASKREISDTVRQFAKTNAEAFDDVFDYWFENIFRSLEVIVKKNSVAVKRKIAAARRKGKSTGKAVVEALTFALMDHMLSNGKLLRFATFAECEREGGWLDAVARRGKPTQLVGNVLTEQDLRNLKARNAPARSRPRLVA